MRAPIQAVLAPPAKCGFAIQLCLERNQPLPRELQSNMPGHTRKRRYPSSAISSHAKLDSDRGKHRIERRMIKATSSLPIRTNQPRLRGHRKDALRPCHASHSYRRSYRRSLRDRSRIILAKQIPAQAHIYRARHSSNMLRPQRGRDRVAHRGKCHRARAAACIATHGKRLCAQNHNHHQHPRAFPQHANHLIDSILDAQSPHIDSPAAVTHLTVNHLPSIPICPPGQ